MMRKNIIKSIAFIALIVLAFGQLSLAAGKSDELINQLDAITKQSNVQKPFSEVIDLTEQSVKILQQEYFEIDEDYTNVVLGDKLKKITEYLSKIAQNNADAYQNKLNELEKQNKQLNIERDATYAQMTQKEKEKNELSGKINGISARRVQLEKDRDEAQRAADAAKSKLDEANEDYDNLKKWFWVPGYGQYLAVKNIIYEAEADEKRASQQLQYAQNQINTLNNEEYNLRNDFNSLTNEKNKIENKINSYEQQVKKCTDEINLIKPQKIQYSNIALFFANTAATFKYNDNEVKRILKELSNVRKEFYTKTTGG